MPPRWSFDRAAATARLATERFDVLVVGGGVTGAGVALDAASRGLRTALVEKDDFASGTSSKSSKLIHGGLRYLQTGEVRLVYQALAERTRLQRNAPHLVTAAAVPDPAVHAGTVCSTASWRGGWAAPCGCTTPPAASGSARCTSRLSTAEAHGLHADAGRRPDGRGLPVLRRPGRRRPAHARPGPDRGHRVRRRGRQPAAGRGVRPRRRADGRRRPGGRRPERRRADGAGHDRCQRDRRVVRRGARPSTTGPRPDPGAGRPRASTSRVPWDKLQEHDRRRRARPRRQALGVRHPVGTGRPTSARPTPTTTGRLDDPLCTRRRRRLPARRAQPGGHHRRRPRRTCSGPGPGCARWCATRPAPAPPTSHAATASTGRRAG